MILLPWGGTLGDVWELASLEDEAAQVPVTCNIR